MLILDEIYKINLEVRIKGLQARLDMIEMCGIVPSYVILGLKHEIITLKKELKKYED